MDVIIEALLNLLNKLDVTHSILLLLLMASWIIFAYVSKKLWDKLEDSQEKRIEEGKQAIKMQETTTIALNNLSKVVEVGFNIVSSMRWEKSND